jgi:mRNA interferase MazF
VPIQEMPLTRWPVPKIPKQYEIWFAELGDHYGTSVQSGNRPVLVISNDMANRNSPIITVIPMSSKLKKLELPVHIPVTGRDCEMLRDEGLEESILLVEQITTIDKMVLCNRLCRVTSAKKKQEIEAAVKKQFAMQACMGREAQA